MTRIVFAFVSALMVCLLIGCSGGQGSPAEQKASDSRSGGADVAISTSSSNGEEPSRGGSYGSTSSSAVSTAGSTNDSGSSANSRASSKETGRSYEVAKEQAPYEPLQIKRGDLFYPVFEDQDTWVERMTSWDPYWPDSFLFVSEDLANCDLPVLDRGAGDTLAMLDDVRYSLIKLEDHDEYINRHTRWSSALDDGIGIYEVVDKWETIDGVAMTKNGPEDEQVLAAKGARYMLTDDDGEGHGFIVGPKGTSFELAGYEGVDLVTEELRIDDKYYTWTEDDEYEPEVEKTPNGYFLIDVSDLDPGVYGLHWDHNTPGERQYRWFIEIA